MWARKRQRIESHKQDRKGDSESGKDIKKKNLKLGGGETERIERHSIERISEKEAREIMEEGEREK